jgi:hypothetical protein
MRSILKTGMAAAALSASFAISGVAPASAAEAARTPSVDLSQAYPGESYTQFRRTYRYDRRGRPVVVDRYYGGPRYGYDRGYYRRDRGAAAAAGIAGLAAGAIIGGALANQAAQAQVVDQNYIAYCSQKYRSFDPASGTYLGYDGERHACQYP